MQRSRTDGTYRRGRKYMDDVIGEPPLNWQPPPPRHLLFCTCFYRNGRRMWCNGSISSTGRRHCWQVHLFFVIFKCSSCSLSGPTLPLFPREAALTRNVMLNAIILSSVPAPSVLVIWVFFVYQFLANFWNFLKNSLAGNWGAEERVQKRSNVQKTWVYLFRIYKRWRLVSGQVWAS